MQVMRFAVREPFSCVFEQSSASKLPPHPELPRGKKKKKKVTFLEKVADKSFPCRNLSVRQGLLPSEIITVAV